MKPTQEQALDWAFECDFVESTPAEDVFSSIYVCCPKDIERLVTLAYEAGRKDEREKVAQWIIQRSYATGHGDTTEDLLAELEWQVREAELKEKNT